MVALEFFIHIILQVESTLRPLTEMSTRNVSCEGKGDITTLCVDCLAIWKPHTWRGLYSDCFNLTTTINSYNQSSTYKSLIRIHISYYNIYRVYLYYLYKFTLE